MTDVEDASALAIAKDLLSAHDDRVQTHLLDVRDPEAWHAVVDEVRAQWGPIDVLVNNAGIMILGDFLSVDTTLDARRMDVNVRGVVNGRRALLPEMLRRGRGAHRGYCVGSRSGGCTVRGGVFGDEICGCGPYRSNGDGV